MGETPQHRHTWPRTPEYRRIKILNHLRAPIPQGKIRQEKIRQGRIRPGRIHQGKIRREKIHQGRIRQRDAVPISANALTWRRCT